MLRTLVLILLTLNLAFFSWTQGWLNPIIGVSPSAQHEPHRLAEQVHADQLTVIPPPHAASEALAKAISQVANDSEATALANDLNTLPLEEPSPATPQPELAHAQCLRAGPFGTMEMSIVTNNIQPTLTPDQWRTEEVTIEGLWFVYMGPYPDRELFRRKQSELRDIAGISFQEVRTPTSLANGFVLGRFDEPQAAQNALEKLRERGVRSARVVIVRPRMQAQNVIVAQGSPSLQAALDKVKLPQGKRFAPCP